jgi:hypothetical protein
MAAVCALALLPVWTVDTARAQGAGGASARAKPEKQKREPIKIPVASVGCNWARSAGKPYFVEFRSRGAVSYGHTFVFHGTLGGGNRFAGFKVAGLHPAGEDPETYLKGHMVPVPAETGVSYGDLDEQYLTARFCVTLTGTEYTKVAAYIRHLQATKKTWHAPGYNCNSFAADIARFMGLDTPNPNLYLPELFINRLADYNKKSGLTLKISDLREATKPEQPSLLGR